jgi:2-phosphoglycerate kinase
MVTHDLMQRGLSFDEAYALARSVRDQLRDRDEISTSELRDLLAREVEEQFGTAPWLGSDRRPAPALEVVDPAGVAHPFSRGLLANSIQAAGVELDRAYRLVAQLQADLRAGNVKSLSNEDLAGQVGDLLERFEGSETAARYRTVRGLQHLPRPLVIYIGGASGTGKSTLSLELAPLLKIYRVNATDTIRQVMRMVFAPSILPAIHRSSFERPVGDDLQESEAGPATGAESDRELTAGFAEQATHVCVGVRAVVERALAENMHVLVEGVHLLPPLVPFTDLEGAAYQLPLTLFTLAEEVHRKRFLARGRHGRRESERYLASFGESSSRRRHCGC